MVMSLKMKGPGFPAALGRSSLGNMGDVKATSAADDRIREVNKANQTVMVLGKMHQSQKSSEL